MKKVLFMLLVAFGVLACNGQQSNPGGGDVSVTEATGMVKQDKELVILDVRTPEEYQSGHLAGAQNMNYYDANFAQQLEDLPRDKRYLVYCHSGGRSAKALKQMKESGFKEVYNLKGGVTAWKAEDGKIEK